MRVLRTLCRISLSPDSCVSQTETIFMRFGPASMLFAKFIPGFASVATAMAGAVGLRYWKFLLFDAMGAMLWVGVALVLGRIFRDAIVDMLETLQSLGKYGLRARGRRARGVRRVEVVAAPAVHPAVADGPRDGRRAAADDRRRQRRHDPRRALAADAGGERPHSRRAPRSTCRTIERRASTACRRDDEVIVYCACPNEASAVKVAQAAERARLQARAAAARRHRRVDRRGARGRALSEPGRNARHAYAC